MTVTKYMLFFTTMCPKCTKIIGGMDENTAQDKEWMNCATNEGLDNARKSQE